VLPESDPYFQTLYGMRNDSESINSAYKRTLLVDRAAVVGCDVGPHLPVQDPLPGT